MIGALKKLIGKILDKKADSVSVNHLSQLIVNMPNIKPLWLAELAKASSLFYDYLPKLKSTRGGKLVADTRDQQPFGLGEWGPIVR